MTAETRAYIQGYAQAIASTIKELEALDNGMVAKFIDKLRARKDAFTIDEMRKARVGGYYLSILSIYYEGPNLCP